MKNTLLLSFMVCGIYLSAQDTLQHLTFDIDKKYLNLPIQMLEDRNQMTFTSGDELVRYFDIRISNGEPDYWVFADVSAFKGKKIIVKYPKSVTGLSKIYQSDIWAGQDSVYRETNRPQIHFSSRRGWNNDPNGLVYYDSEYHLFYQHNPYETHWGNMHWGHAVSKDLLHWEELGEVLYPDELGAMFSGTAAIDHKNTAGFQTGDKPALVAAYTAHKDLGEGKGALETQCIAYSNDGGRTFTKYEGNPVIDSKAKWNSSNTRDPKIFWYEPTQKWVMVLFEKDGHSFYNSDDFKEWTYQSHIVGFWECPELFELPIDGDKNNTKWVIYGASGTYMVGDFDGTKFTPTSGKHQYVQGQLYAAQTYNNIPAADGRRIQLGWGQDMWHKGMPFSQLMLFPTELTLRTTINGVRLFNEPIKEIEQLHKKSYSWKNLTTQGANENLKTIDGDIFHIKMKVTINDGTRFNFLYHGNSIVEYDMNFNTLNDAFYENGDAGSRSIGLEILIDRTSVEIFADGGAFTVVSSIKEAKTNGGLAFLENKNIKIHSLEVHQLNSIWENAE